MAKTSFADGTQVPEFVEVYTVHFSARVLVENVPWGKHSRFTPGSMVEYQLRGFEQKWMYKKTDKVDLNQVLFFFTN